ncbi:MAG: tyrosine-type recombinase/integrase [Candidatus Zixiibacteriota bacterium]
MASIQLKKGKNGRRTYFVVVSFQGKHKWVRAGSLADAKRLKKEIEGLAENERFEKLGLSVRDKRIDDFFSGYIEHVRLRTSPNTVKRYRAAINAFLAFLRLFHSSVRYLSQLKQEHIEAYQRRRLESVELKIEADGVKNGNHKNKRLPKPQTVNYEIGILRSAFLWAQDHNWIAAIPTRKVKRLKAGPKRQIRILSQEECSLLLVTARQMALSDPKIAVYARAFQFLLNSGLRSGELCNLTWDDVDLESALIQIRSKPGWTPKTSERSFYLNQTCLGILKSIGKREGYVLVDEAAKHLEKDELRKVLITVAEAAGLDGLTRVHDLRHTFASLMQMNGVEPGTVATILGHKDLGTTRIYTHQTQEHLKKSIEKVGVG